jgi:hypothetical protein
VSPAAKHKTELAIKGEGKELSLDELPPWPGTEGKIKVSPVGRSLSPNLMRLIDVESGDWRAPFSVHPGKRYSSIYSRRAHRAKTHSTPGVHISRTSMKYAIYYTRCSDLLYYRAGRAFFLASSLIPGDDVRLVGVPA